MNPDESALKAGIGERVRQERQRLSLSPEEFAAKVGMHRSTLFNYESGARVPDALLLQRMHHELHVDVQFVVTGQPAAISKLSLTQEEVAKKLGDMPERLQQLVADVTHVTWMAFDARRSYDYGTALSTDNAPAPMQVHDPAPTYARKKR